MNKKISIIILSILPLISFAQKTKITTIQNGLIIYGKNEKKENYIVNKKQFDNNAYFMAICSGYATQVFKLDTLLNQPEYFVKLIPISPLNEVKVKNKIIFSGFADKENKIKIREYGASYYDVNFLNLSSNYFKNPVNERLSEFKFKVSEDLEVFKSKKNAPDFALAGEILDYKKDTQGQGFQISVVVRWTFYDISNEQTICKFITGGYSDLKIRMAEKDALRDAFKDALSGVIINNDVQKYIYGESEQAKFPVQKEIVFQRVKNETNDENVIQKAILSSITIKTKSGHGSGFLINSGGYILTNYHVIDDSVDMQGIFQNGLSLPIKVISFDKKTDVALCKIPGKGYKSLAIDTVSVISKIGSDVIAIGTPQDIDLGQTVTKGIISGLRDYKGTIYIQTDVSINAGNSGGMLINKNGEVIGIVSAKIKGVGIEGLGFAIPINIALKTLNIKFKE